MSRRQLRNWLAACLEREKRPDVLEVVACEDDYRLQVVTRKVGTREDRGACYTVGVYEGPPKA